MAFGGGLRLCAGADFSKMQMAMFLHYLVTNYRQKNLSMDCVSTYQPTIYDKIIIVFS
jgi:cytochrome P450